MSLAVSRLLLPLLAFILVLTPFTHASPEAIGPSSPLSPWLITRLWTFTPSGRPGSSPWSTLNFTISDPNTIIAGTGPQQTFTYPAHTANCSAQWSSTLSVPAWNRTINCTQHSYEFAYWSFEILYPETNGTVYDYPSASEHFDLRIRLTDTTNPGNQKYFWKQSFEGRVGLEVGGNMGGICGASGVCSWSLKDDKTPLEVRQHRTDCTGLCG
ncbi:hypothetical protein DL546_002593 [Coniochaeta pulveracea]|uniref:Uncharacterized protein n=1 Tax=Coniochaeta pulveracea TaxID=177199 RepID=A0A420XWY4_9PEZI|nr:hypothetical protein DL546_002593 [Coniochaeta pulveracea]